MVKNKYIIYRDREAAPTPAHWVQFSLCSDIVRDVYKIEPLISWNIFKKGRLLAYYHQEKLLKARNKIGNLFFNDLNYFEKIKKEINIAKNNFCNLFNIINGTDLKKMSAEELVQLATSMLESYKYYEAVNTAAWFLGAEVLNQKIKEEINIPNDDFLFLTSPHIETAVSQLDHELLKKVRDVYNNKVTIDEAADILSEKYGWIPHGFDGPEYWDRNYFVLKIQNILNNDFQYLLDKLNQVEKKKKIQEERIRGIINKYKIKEEHLELLNRLHQTTVWTDERRGLTFKMYYYHSQILHVLSRRLEIPVINLKYIFTEELLYLLDTPKVLKDLSETRINKDFLVEYSISGMRLMSELETKDFLQEISCNIEKDLCGVVASRGDQDIYLGKVKILLSSKDCYKVEAGDFVVATMTTPDYIIAMQKAAGFITDEGGVTCHAAITAREMGKPCIIATGNATRSLKDGNNVEMNMKNGTIKIVN